MDLKELQRVIDEEPTPAAPETVKEVERMDQNEEKEPETPLTMPENSKQTTPPALSWGQFGVVLTSIYCSISDAVFKKVKNCKTAPAWEPETRQAISETTAALLESYDVPMSPVWQLVITLAMVEATRYTLLNPE